MQPKGKREGAGRKPLDPQRPDELVRRMVTLPQDVVERLLAMDQTGRYDKGSLSLGILEALRQLDELQGKLMRIVMNPGSSPADREDTGRE